MRQIKFRFWNKKHKLYEYRYDLNNEGELSDPCEGGCYSLEDQDNFIIQQFTGLLDKNDTEIYEGDILQIEHFSFYVTYDEGCFIVKEFKPTEMNFALSNMNKFSVIVGNIHENTELLEVQK